MPSARPTLIPVALYVLLCISYAYSNPQSGSADRADEISLRIVRTASTIAITGTISSAAHEVILRQTANRLFPGLRQDFDVQQRSALPAGWALLSELALRASAETSSANVLLSSASVHVKGITNDVDAWQAAALRLHQHLLPGMKLTDGVVSIGTSLPHRERCRALLEAATEGRSVQFVQSGSDIKSNAFPMLDEIVQIATDCPATTMTITGHTDASGEESANRILSEARARAVANYLIARGVSPDRIAVTGAGSSDPLLTGRDAHARRANRRIDFRFQ